MSYVPPRGPCGYKTSLMSPTCACLRFMIHPVKAATSFECDGCGHHASYHKMENKTEEELIKRWKTSSEGIFFQEGNQLDTEQVHSRKHRRLEIQMDHSSAEMTPEKIQSVCLAPGRKRIRAQKSFAFD